MAANTPERQAELDQMRINMAKSTEILKAALNQPQALLREQAGRKSKYPWAEWTNGEWHDVWEGDAEDGGICENIEHFRTYLYSYAKRHRLEVTTQTVQDGAIAFRFRPRR